MRAIRRIFPAFLLAAVASRAAVVNGNLTVNSFAAYAGQTNIVLQATGSVIFTGGTLNLPDLPTGASSGLLKLGAGNDVVLNDGVTIVGGTGWSVTLEAGLTNFETSAAIDGNGNITLLGTASLVVAGGSINLLAGDGITVADGTIGTGGGDVFITALGGSVSTGSRGQIGTLGNGAVSIYAGGDVSGTIVGTITNLTAGGITIISTGPAVPIDGGTNCPARPGRVCPQPDWCPQGRFELGRGRTPSGFSRFTPPRHQGWR